MSSLGRTSSFDVLLQDLDNSELIPTIRNTMKELFHLRLYITLAAIAWGAWVTWRIYKSDSAKEENDKYVQMHRVWFGTRPLLEALFSAWATSVVIAIVMRAATKWFRTV
jgi:steroid 5-alpha reductase family enzyme